jgi:hypothetical protein
LINKTDASSGETVQKFTDEFLEEFNKFVDVRYRGGYVPG